VRSGERLSENHALWCTFDMFIWKLLPNSVRLLKNWIFHMAISDARLYGNRTKRIVSTELCTVMFSLYYRLFYCFVVFLFCTCFIDLHVSFLCLLQACACNMYDQPSNT